MPPVNLELIVTYPEVGKNSEAGDKAWAAFGKVNANSAAIQAAIQDAEIKAFIVPCTPEDGEVNADYSDVSFRMAYGFVVTEVRASLNSAADADVIIDILAGGTSILDSTMLVIPSGSTSSVDTSGGKYVDYVELPDDIPVTINCLQGGSSSAPGIGLKVTIKGYAVDVSY